MRNLSEQLLQIFNPADVAELSWNRASRHRPGVVPDPSSHFDWPDLETLLQRDLGNADDYSFCKGGQELDKDMFKLVGKGNSLNLRSLQSLADQGVAIVIKQMQQKFSHFWRDARTLEEALGVKLRLVCFSSLGRAAGFPLHYDFADIIVVQTVGRKHWTFYGEPVAGPIARHAGPKPTEVTGELVMNAGDCLFLPCGLHHRCEALDPSIHLVFLLYRPSGFDLLSYLAARHDDDTILGARLLPDADGAGQQEALLKERLIELVRKVDMAAFVRDWRVPPDAAPPLRVRPEKTD